MEPWWIISIGTPTENIKKILTAYTNYSHIIDHDYNGWNEQYKWWYIDNLEVNKEDLLITLSKFLNNNANYITTRDTSSNCKIPAIDNLEKLSLNIIIIASVFDAYAQNLFHTIPSLLRNKKNILFPGRDIKIFGMLYVPLSITKKSSEEQEKILEFLTELNILMNNEVPVANRPFDNIFLFQDKNSDPVNNNGYNDIDDSDVYDLISQVILHLSIGDTNFFSQKFLCPGSTPYLHAGATGIYYDFNNHLLIQSKELGEFVLDKFKNSTENPWVEEGTQNVIISNSHIIENIKPEIIFKSLTKNVPPFNFYSDIWVYPENVSPLEFWKAKLIPVYFGVYTKNLIVRLVEYGRISVKNAFEKFDILLKKNKENFLHDSNIAKKNIRDAVYSIWQNTSPSSPCGLVQAEQIIDKIKNKIEEFKNSSNLSTEKLNVFHIPDYIQEFYDTAKEDFSIDEEKEIIERIKNRLEHQPVFSALLIRAFLTGIGLVFVGIPILNLLSPNWINIKFLSDLPYIFPLIIFLIPFIAAYGIYTIRLLNPIRKYIKKYIAFILKPCQKKAKDKVSIYISIVYDELIKYCDSLLEEIKEIREKWNYPDIPQSFFPDTMFQKNAISGKLNNESIFKIDSKIGLLFTNGKSSLELKRDKTEIFNLFKNILAINLTDTNGENKFLSEYLINRNYNILIEKIKEFCVDGFKNSKKNLYDLMQDKNLNPKIKEELLGLSYPPGNIENYTDKVESELKVNIDWTLPDIFKGIDYTNTISNFYFSIMRCRDIGLLKNFKLNFFDRDMENISKKMKNYPKDSLIISCVFTDNEQLEIKLLDDKEISIRNKQTLQKYNDFKKALNL